MADEITIKVGATAAKNEIYVTLEDTSRTISMVGTAMFQGTMVAPIINNAVVVVGGVTAPAHVIIWNPSTNTQPVTVYQATSNAAPYAVLHPGDPACVMPRTPTLPFVLAATSTQEIGIIAIKV